MTMMTNMGAPMIQSVPMKVQTSGLIPVSHPHMPPAKSRDSSVQPGRTLADNKCLRQFQLNEEAMEAWRGEYHRSSPEVLLHMLSGSRFRNGSHRGGPRDLRIQMLLILISADLRCAAHHPKIMIAMPFQVKMFFEIIEAYQRRFFAYRGSLSINPGNGYSLQCSA